MLAAPRAELEARAERLRAGIAAGAPRGAGVGIVPAAGRAGGGSLPLLELEGPAVAVTRRRGRRRRAARARCAPATRRSSRACATSAVLLDPRTIAEVEVDFVVRGVLAALG